MDVYFTWPWVPSIRSFPSAARRCLTIHDNVTGPDSIAASEQQCTSADAYDVPATVNVSSVHLPFAFTEIFCDSLFASFLRFWFLFKLGGH